MSKAIIYIEYLAHNYLTIYDLKTVKIYILNVDYHIPKNSLDTGTTRQAVKRETLRRSQNRSVVVSAGGSRV